jgi:CP family cyanate transporter-like MFS transporter
MTLTRSLKVGIPIFLVAVNMRAGLILIGPLLPIIKEEYGLSVFMESILGAAPLICFSLSALFMSRLIRKADTNRIITYAITLVALSLILRTIYNIPALLFFSITLGIAVAILNFMLPIWVRENNTGNAGLITGTYAAIMGIFSAVALAVTVPLATMTSFTWRFSMVPWFIVAAVTSVLWWVKIRNSKPNITNEQMPNFWKSPILRSRKAWSLTLFFGMLNMIHYASAVWMPTILVEKGMRLVDTGFLVALATVIGSLLSLAVPHFASRGKDFRLVLFGFSGVLALSYIAVAVDSGPRLWLWVVLCNVGVYVTFALALFLVIFNGSNDDNTKNLSIMMQSVGYLLATTAPIVLGGLFVLTGSWSISLFFLVALAALQMIFSFKTGDSEKV